MASTRPLLDVQFMRKQSHQHCSKQSVYVEHVCNRTSTSSDSQPHNVQTLRYLKCTVAFIDQQSNMYSHLSQPLCADKCCCFLPKRKATVLQAIHKGTAVAASPAGPNPSRLSSSLKTAAPMLSPMRKMIVSMHTLALYFSSVEMTVYKISLAGLAKL